MTRPPLRIGLLLDSYELPAWAYSALLPIANCDYARFSLVVTRNPSHAFESPWQSLWRDPNHIVYRIFDLVDSTIHRSAPDPFALVDARPLLREVPTLPLTPRMTGDCEEFTPHDIQTIRQHAPEILINLGSRPLRGTILSAAPHGVWSYHHGDIRTNRNGPAGFWEVVESWPETPFSLYVLSEDSSFPLTLYKSSSFTHPYSPAQNRRYCFWASSSLLSRQLSLLHRLGAARFRAAIQIHNDPFRFNDRPPYGCPSNPAAIRAVATLTYKLLRRACHKAMYRDQWILLRGMNNAAASSLSSYQPLVPPKDRFWADPFVLRVDNEYYVFVEEYLYKSKKGRISVITLDSAGRSTESSVVLEKEYHLSYPFVFSCNGKYFMVPESAENRTIDLYECVDFPLRWTLRLTLMKNVSAVDTTLLHHNGRWWLFTGLAENEGSLPLVELFLFYSDDLITDRWHPHPNNPIVSDVKRARPAGRLFSTGDRLFRPSQDCSKTYGYGFDVNEILVLSESEYREEKVISVRPHWDRRIKATHTLAMEDGLTVVDALTRRARLF